MGELNINPTALRTIKKGMYKFSSDIAGTTRSIKMDCEVILIRAKRELEKAEERAAGAASEANSCQQAAKGGDKSAQAELAGAQANLAKREDELEALKVAYREMERAISFFQEKVREFSSYSEDETKRKVSSLDQAIAILKRYDEVRL